MSSRRLQYFFFVILISTSGFVVRGDDVTVDIPHLGKLLGMTVDFTESVYANVSKTLNVFKGIPYAEPPGRFMPTEPKESWTEVYNATVYGNSCEQYDNYAAVDALYTYSEDCLYMNIFAPHGITDHKVPVMVFIHGGGYTSGSSMSDSYSGVPLAAIGHVVMVTFNYRLGVSGFLDTGNADSPGNYGLLDQAEALRFIRNNIEVFGGDSSKITIFGVSAGSGSVDLHLHSKYSRDHFDQAILESGVTTAPWTYNDFYESNKVNAAFQLGRLANCATSDTSELVACLRQVDARTLENIAQTNTIRFGPTIDGTFLDESPFKLNERGDFKDCPVVMGFNRDEGTLVMPFYYTDYATSEEAPFVNKSAFNMLVTESQRSYNPRVFDLLDDSIKQQYVDWSQWDNHDHDYFDTIVKIFGDDSFSCPSVQVARERASMSSHPVYLYYFTQVPSSTIFTIDGYGPGWLGAGHGEEVQYVFGYPFIPELEGWHPQMTEEESAFSVKMMQFWTNFAKSGDPGKPDLASPPGEGDWEWPVFTIPELEYKELAMTMTVDRGLKADECAYWNGFKPQLLSYLESMDHSELEWREEFSSWQDDLEEWRMAFNEYQQDPVCNP